MVVWQERISWIFGVSNFPSSSHCPDDVWILDSGEFTGDNLVSWMYYSLQSGLVVGRGTRLWRWWGHSLWQQIRIFSARVDWHWTPLSVEGTTVSAVLSWGWWLCCWPISMTWWWWSPGIWKIYPWTQLSHWLSESGRQKDACRNQSVFVLVSLSSATVLV